MAGTIHIVGAGLAGLSAAVHLAASGRRVVVYESAGQAGGRCRSFFDASLGRTIDNGNHLLLSGNRSAARYLQSIGSADGFHQPTRAEYPFFDLRTGERWTVRPDRGAIPWSLFFRDNRVPGSRPIDYLRGLRLAWAPQRASVGDCLAAADGLFERFWEPLAVSVLNTPADEASARLLWPVIRETFGRGEAACRPLIAKTGLSDALIDPALDYLRRHSGEIRLRQRVRGLRAERDRLAGLALQHGEIPVAADDAVVLAVPATAARELMPDLTVPDRFEPIVNAHFILPEAGDEVAYLGLVGGVCHWLFVRGDVASVTVSAARHLTALPGDLIAERMWPEVCLALGLGDRPLGPFRLVKEKRATFSQTLEQVERRPGPKTPFANLFLCGDWTDTGLPATIEGSIRSGDRVADTVAELF